MYYYLNIKAVSIHITLISLILLSNFCNAYGQSPANSANKANSSVSQNDVILAKNITLLNEQVAKLTSIINSNLKNNSGAINAPFANVTDIFKQIGGGTPLNLLAVVAIAMVIPLVIDMLLAYRRNSNVKSDDKGNHSVIGMPGLYRTLMTFGVVLLTGIVLLYLLLLITIYNNTALIETLRNLSTILGTGLATIIAFYFGMRGSESAIEKVARKLTPAGTIGADVSLPSVIKTKPNNNEENMPINTEIYAIFNEPMKTSPITIGVPLI